MLFSPLVASSPNRARFGWFASHKARSVRFILPIDGKATNRNLEPFRNLFFLLTRPGPWRNKPAGVWIRIFPMLLKISEVRARGNVFISKSASSIKQRRVNVVYNFDYSEKEFLLADEALFVGSLIASLETDFFPPQGLEVRFQLEAGHLF